MPQWPVVCAVVFLTQMAVFPLVILLTRPILNPWPLPGHRLNVESAGAVNVGEMAIVFNSGTLMAREFGPEIDRNHYVLRFNFAWPLQSKAKHIGTRTTHMVFGPQAKHFQNLYQHELLTLPHTDPFTNAYTSLILSFDRGAKAEVVTRSRMANVTVNPFGRELVIMPHEQRMRECPKSFGLHTRECAAEHSGMCSCSSGALIIHFFLQRDPRIFSGVHRINIFGFHQDCHYRLHWWDRPLPLSHNCTNQPYSAAVMSQVHDIAYEHSVVEQLAAKGDIRIVS